VVNVVNVVKIYEEFVFVCYGYGSSGTSAVNCTLGSTPDVVLILNQINYHEKVHFRYSISILRSVFSGCIVGILQHEIASICGNLLNCQLPCILCNIVSSVGGGVKEKGGGE
jgi:uncharacterized protein with PQ loop repeat